MTMSTAFLLQRADNGTVGSDDTGRPRRRRFTREYKHAILAEYDALSDPGAKGALLRREGLYTSHLAEWRRIARQEASGTAPGRPATAAARTAEQRELERLRRRAARLEAELATHRLALEIQGKASELLERLLAESDEEPRQQR
jgi:transposase-like protein